MSFPALLQLPSPDWSAHHACLSSKIEGCAEVVMVHSPQQRMNSSFRRVGAVSESWALLFVILLLLPLETALFTPNTDLDFISGKATVKCVIFQIVALIALFLLSSSPGTWDKSHKRPTIHQTDHPPSSEFVRGTILNLQ